MLCTIPLLLTSCGSKQRTMIAPRKRAVKKNEHTTKLEKRNKRTIVPHASADLTTLSLEQLRERKDGHLVYQNYTGALECLNRMLTICSAPEELSRIRLEAADTIFELGDLEKAQLAYHDYATFYPGSEHAEYAAYKEILCIYYQTLDHDRDQTLTKEAIERSRQFLAQKTFSSYTNDVKSVRKHCILSLFEHESEIIKFYLEQNKLTAVEQRLIALREQFASSELNPRIITLELELARKQNDEPMIKTKQQELALIDPALLIEEQKSHTAYAARF